MLKVNVSSARNFNASERRKLNDAIKLIETVVNSAVFKNRVLNHQFNGRPAFNWNRNMTNQQIFDLFMSGKERRSSSSDQEIDLALSISDVCPRDAIGTTYNQERTETYRCKLNNMDAAEYAGHLIHEWCHYLGFGHSVEWTPNRRYTVPYAIGYMVRDLSATVQLTLNGEELVELNEIYRLKKEQKEVEENIFIEEIAEVF